MRVFFAIEFDDHMKAELKQRKDRVLSHVESPNITCPNNYHITLKYIGESTEEDISKMTTAMTNVADRHHPFNINVDAANTFQKGNHHIVYLALSPSESLDQLYKDLQRSLNTIGFDEDTRPYTPHITLAKKARLKQPLPDISPLNYKVKGLSLMQSHRVDGNLTYTRIAYQPF